MAIENEGISNAGAAWSALLSLGVGFLGYLAKKRDEAIEANARSHNALELKVAETYATKQTVLALFQEATRTNEAAIARVEKSVDLTNVAIAKQGEKIDKVVESIGQFQNNVMLELSKKT